MAKQTNVDVWAASNLGYFFPARSNNTFEDEDLTGQCVSLIKWYLNDFTTVPNPANARGHAKDYGDTLVSQGYADKVSTVKVGDIVVWKLDGGGYGHIGIYTSNGVFEQNVGGLGSSSKQVIGGYNNGKPIYVTVYSARVDPLYASFRKGSPTFYRVKDTFKGENMDKLDKELVQILCFGVLQRDGLAERPNALADAYVAGYIGRNLDGAVIREIFYSPEAKTRRDSNVAGGNKDINRRLANEKVLAKENTTLKARIKELEAQANAQYIKVTDLYIKK